jgi:hypothetical protein
MCNHFNMYLNLSLRNINSLAKFVLCLCKGVLVYFRGINIKKH